MTDLEQVEMLRNMLLAQATGGESNGPEYLAVRRALMAKPEIEAMLPRFVKTCRDVSQFWAFIKAKFPSYQERREYLWAEFRPLVDKLEGVTVAPSDASIGSTLERFDADRVHQVWGKALERRYDDPEGAITAARTLLETVCKYVLDASGVVYDDAAELPQLYKATANTLNLSPHQHQEQIFKQILGGCQTVVEGLGAMRNKLSDAHGRGRSQVKPVARHAELAVNLAGSMASFIVSTWEARQQNAV